MINLLPIAQTLEENHRFTVDSSCDDTLARTIAYFQKLGYKPPWIGYYAELNGEIVGTGAFKGPPKNNKVEIAYVVWENHRSKGIGNAICAALVSIWKNQESSIILTAQTLPEYGHSNCILSKNGFVHTGQFEHPKDGPVWVWEYRP